MTAHALCVRRGHRHASRACLDTFGQPEDSVIDILHCDIAGAKSARPSASTFRSARVVRMPSMHPAVADPKGTGTVLSPRARASSSCGVYELTAFPGCFLSRTRPEPENIRANRESYELVGLGFAAMPRVLVKIGYFGFAAPGDHHVNAVVIRQKVRAKRRRSARTADCTAPSVPMRALGAPVGEANISSHGSRARQLDRVSGSSARTIQRAQKSAARS